MRKTKRKDTDNHSSGLPASCEGEFFKLRFPSPASPGQLSKPHSPDSLARKLNSGALLCSLGRVTRAWRVTTPVFLSSWQGHGQSSFKTNGKIRLTSVKGNFENVFGDSRELCPIDHGLCAVFERKSQVSLGQTHLVLIRHHSRLDDCIGVLKTSQLLIQNVRELVEVDPTVQVEL